MLLICIQELSRTNISWNANSLTEYFWFYSAPPGKFYESTSN